MTEPLDDEAAYEFYQDPNNSQPAGPGRRRWETKGDDLDRWEDEGGA